MATLARNLMRQVCVIRACHSSNKTVDFGYDKVPENVKQEKVYGVFENVANKYDIMNDAMSFGIHRWWKDVFVQRLCPPHGTRLLDVAGGTGDIAFRVLNHLKEVPRGDDTKPSHVTITDINKAMLDVSRERAKSLVLGPGDTVDWLESNAENLSQIEDGSYSAYTIAFGIRNVTHIDKVLKEAHRVLMPGGRFLCLEFSHVENNYLRQVYDLYSFQVIPAIGQVIAGDWKSYQYLVESIRMFPNQEKFKKMIENAGFKCVSYENLTFGVVAIHSGFKL